MTSDPSPAHLNHIGSVTSTRKATGVVRRYKIPLALILLFLTGFAIYLYFAIRFYGSHVNVAHNYSAEYDAERAATVPGGILNDSNRAWPVLKQLQTKLRSPESANKSWPHPAPGSQGWADALAVLQSNPGILDQLRTAADRPTMGHFLSGDEDPDDPSSTGKVGAKNLPLLACLVTHLGSARNGARWLMFDIDVAVRDRDPARAAADLRAALSLAQLCDSKGMLIEQLVRFAITALAIDHLSRLLADNPGFLSDQQLLDLAPRVVAAVGSEPGAISLDFERLIQLDQAQRMFTDDRRGDGYLCAQGEQYLEAMAGGNNMTGLDRLLHRLAAPSLVKRFGTRRQYIATFDRLSAPFLPENRKPLWETPVINPAVAEAERVMADKSIKPAQRLPAMLIPSIGKAVTSGESMIQIRDAALVTIALERQRLAHGTYPTSLDALVPTLLDRIPPDRFDGKPLKYRVADKVPVLYSIGADLSDNGGTPMRKSSGDIVRVDMNRENPTPGDWVFFPPPRDPPPPAP